MVLSVMGKRSEWPRVLVAAPTSIRHAYVVDDWLRGIRGLDYPADKIEVMVVENTSSAKDPNEEYYSHLKNLGIRVVRYPWVQEKQHVLRMLATCREIYRHVAYFEKFDFVFHVDTDIILPKNALKTLVSRDKDLVGPVVHVFGAGSVRPEMPCVYRTLGVKPGRGLDQFSWKELAKIEMDLRGKKKPLVSKVAAGALGCLLVKRRVFERVPFSAHASINLGEDMWFQYNVDMYNDTHGTGFEWWVDFTVKVEHRNTDWAIADEKGSHSQTWHIFHGPEDAKNIVIRRKEWTKNVKIS